MKYLCEDHPRNLYHVLKPDDASAASFRFWYFLLWVIVFICPWSYILFCLLCCHPPVPALPAFVPRPHPILLVSEILTSHQAPALPFGLTLPWLFQFLVSLVKICLDFLQPDSSELNQPAGPPASQLWQTESDYSLLYLLLPSLRALTTVDI